MASGIKEGLEAAKEAVKNIQNTLPSQLSTYDLTMNILITVAIGGLTIFLIFYYFIFRKIKARVMPSISSDVPNTRFRKRDKVMFYGRKMLRKVHSFTKNTLREGGLSRSGSSSRIRKRQIVMKLARKILRLKKDSQPQLLVKEPPSALLEADWSETESDHRLPSEVMYMLRSVRVFGHFEKPLFLELCKHMESLFIPSGSFLFQVGERDDSIYVVQSGQINVNVTEKDGSVHVMKEVGQGESIHSLLSILDVLTGHPAPYKTVSAVATQDSTVLRLRATAFKLVHEKYPESLVRIVQVIMVRLQRVTFMALHNYLGLSHELINPESQSDMTFSVHSISPRGSPSKVVREGQRASGGVNGDEEKVTKVTYYDKDDASADASKTGVSVAVGGATSRPISVRRSSEPSGRPKHPSRHLSLVESESEVVNTPSDFDAVLHRARVPSINVDNPLAVGSPPIKQSIHEDIMSSQTAVGGKRSRKLAMKEELEYFEDDCTSMQKNQILELATKDIVQLFGLEDDSLLEGKLVLRHIVSGTELIKQGDQESYLIFVVTGTLQVIQQVVGSETEQRSLFVAHPGELVGGLAMLTGEPSFFTIRTKSTARIVTISKSDFYSIMVEQPNIVLYLGHTVVTRMSAFVRQIDFALDWELIEAGRALYRQSDNSDSIFIILNGRLRSVVALMDGKKELVGEYGRGELVGIVEVLTLAERASTVIAVRDTEVAQIPDGLLNMIKRKYPQIVTRLIHLLSQRLLGTIQSKPVNRVLSEHPNIDERPTVANLATVAILPISEDVPVFNFTLELQYALSSIGPSLRLTSDIIKTRLGAAALDTINEYRLSSWLGQQEDIHRMVLYQCDYRLTPWTQRCVRQADCILIVGLAENDPAVGKLESQLGSIAARSQKELILLHKSDAEKPHGTVNWLNARSYVTSHHHIRCPKRVFSKKSPERMMAVYQKLFEMDPDRLSDCSRLARFLTGTSIGLVLGGGGARGLAQVGMIRSMQEAGIPVDAVGGTSIGSFIAAVWAEECDIVRVTQRVREWSKDMASLWKKIVDLTYPVTAMFSGGSFNRSVSNVFKDRQIEDLWIPYFCITTDISSSKMRVHTNGSLWRYVRASMSLSGYLPPLCDPVDGHLLLDGGYVNNLPADVMKAMGAQTIFAVDVGSQDEGPLTNYGDELSGWWLLWKRWYPWATPVRVPNMAEVQTRLAYVSCVRGLEEVKKSDYCEYIRPPIDKYQTLQFGAFDEIHEVGYSHGRTLLSAWDKGLRVQNLFKESASKEGRPVIQQHKVPREADFTDLAELISRIDEPGVTRKRSRESYFYIGSDLDELEEDYEAEDEEEYEDVEDEEKPTINEILKNNEYTMKNRAGQVRSKGEKNLELHRRKNGTSRHTDED